MKRLLALLLCTFILVSLFACDNGTDQPVDTNPSDSDPADSKPNDSEPSDSESTNSEIENTDPVDSDSADTDPVDPEPTTPAYELKLEKLNEIMQPIFSGNTVKNETVMFLDYGDERTLLYPVENMISVTSYDGSVTYTEGKDYSIVDGKIKILAGSSIPCITREKYYNSSDTTLITSYNGKNCNTHWGEGRPMTDWQVNVSYTHTNAWEGFAQECRSETYEKFINKLINGEDVTVFFYGDSITRGANSSWEKNYAPYQYPYTIIFTEALADLFEYKVHYIASGLDKSAKVPSNDYVAGDRGTITYINTAVGGWTSEDALANFDAHVRTFVERYGCDLFISAFGINDGTTARAMNMTTTNMLNKLYNIAPDACVMIVSTMYPNPNASKWCTTQPAQEKLLISTATSLNKNGKTCAVACMTSMSASILERKEFNDYSGNNINHPNDFFIRVYAQTMLQTLLGYENMK